jgi:hypothetical protein
VPTRETIVGARAYSDLAKLDLAALGGNLTWPFIAAAGGQGDSVREGHRSPRSGREG